MAKFQNVFPNNKPIIGMIHLAGSLRPEVVRRAIEELVIYTEEGLDGAIIEDYHGNDRGDLEAVLKESERLKLPITRGINWLHNCYGSFKMADEFGAKFVQIDSVQASHLDLEKYNQSRTQFPSIPVLGGVRFKYKNPTGKTLEEDLKDGMSRCEAVVTTGSGTGRETPLDKLQEFRAYMGQFPLIVGAGVTASNVYRQLSVADGAIVGSYFKPMGDTELPVERSRVRDLMARVRELREAA